MLILKMPKLPLFFSDHLLVGRAFKLQAAHFILTKKSQRECWDGLILRNVI